MNWDIFFPITAGSEEAKRNLNQLEKALGGFARTGREAIDGLHGAAEEAGKQAREAGRAAMESFGASGDTLTETLRELSKTLADVGRERISLEYLARETRSSVEAIEGLKAAGKAMGISGPEQIWRTVANNLLEINQNTEKAGEIWKSLVNMQGINGVDVYDKLYNISKMKDIAEKTAALNKLFNEFTDETIRSRVAALITGSREGWQLWSDLAERIKREMPHKVEIDTHIIEDYLVSSAKLSGQFDNLGRVIFNEVATPFSKLQTQFAAFVDRNRENIASGVVNFFTIIVRAFKDIGALYNKYKEAYDWLASKGFMPDAKGSGHWYPTPPQEFYDRQEKSRKYLEDYLRKHHGKKEMGFEQGGPADKSISDEKTKEQQEKFWRRLLQILGQMPQITPAGITLAGSYPQNAASTLHAASGSPGAPTLAGIPGAAVSGRGHFHAPPGAAAGTPRQTLVARGPGGPILLGAPNPDDRNMVTRIPDSPRVYPPLSQLGGVTRLGAARGTVFEFNFKNWNELMPDIDAPRGELYGRSFTEGYYTRGGQEMYPRGAIFINPTNPLEDYLTLQHERGHVGRRAVANKLRADPNIFKQYYGSRAWTAGGPTPGASIDAPFLTGPQRYEALQKRLQNYPEKQFEEIQQRVSDLDKFRDPGAELYLGGEVSGPMGMGLGFGMPYKNFMRDIRRHNREWDAIAEQMLQEEGGSTTNIDRAIAPSGGPDQQRKLMIDIDAPSDVSVRANGGGAFDGNTQINRTKNDMTGPAPEMQ